MLFIRTSKLHPNTINNNENYNNNDNYFTPMDSMVDFNNSDGLIMKTNEASSRAQPVRELHNRADYQDRGHNNSLYGQSTFFTGNTGAVHFNQQQAEHTSVGLGVSQGLVNVGEHEQAPQMHYHNQHQHQQHHQLQQHSMVSSGIYVNLDPGNNMLVIPHQNQHHVSSKRSQSSIISQQSSTDDCIDYDFEERAANSGSDDQNSRNTNTQMPSNCRFSIDCVQQNLRHRLEARNLHRNSSSQNTISRYDDTDDYEDYAEDNEDENGADEAEDEDEEEEEEEEDEDEEVEEQDANQLSRVEDPLKDRLVLQGLQRIRITSKQLTEMTVKELNKRLSACPAVIVAKLKRCRRTLKNRGYAKSCRIKRIQAKSHLEQVNMELINENERLRLRNKRLLEQLEQIKFRLQLNDCCKSVPSSSPVKLQQQQQQNSYIVQQYPIALHDGHLRQEAGTLALGASGTTSRVTSASQSPMQFDQQKNASYQHHDQQTLNEKGAGHETLGDSVLKAGANVHANRDEAAASERDPDLHSVTKTATNSRRSSNNSVCNVDSNDAVIIKSSLSHHSQLDQLEHEQHQQQQQSTELCDKTGFSQTNCLQFDTQNHDHNHNQTQNNHKSLAHYETQLQQSQCMQMPYVTTYESNQDPCGPVCDSISMNPMHLLTTPVNHPSCATNIVVNSRDGQHSFNQPIHPDW